MTGGKDPFCRQPFPWGREDTELQDYYRTLSRIHALLPGLSQAMPELLRAERGIFSFRRGRYQTVCCTGKECADFLCGRVLLGTGYSMKDGRITVFPGGYVIFEK